MKTAKILFGSEKVKLPSGKKYAIEDIQESAEVLALARMLNKYRIMKMDSLHIACAIHAGADFFLTTDDGILKKSIPMTQDLRITDPIDFIKEVFL